MYNIFTIMNIKDLTPDEKISRMFRAIGSPTRFRILAAIGKGEACVCHLETLLNMRQAYISQQLMELRDAELLETRRDGRFIFYRLRDVQILALIRLAGEIASVELQYLEQISDSLPSCSCPKCDPEVPFILNENEETN